MQAYITSKTTLNCLRILFVSTLCLQFVRYCKLVYLRQKKEREKAYIFSDEVCKACLFLIVN